MNKKEMAALVAQKDLSQLPERERVILQRFYLRDETLAEVAKTLRCYTPERISQLRYQALFRLDIPLPAERVAGLPFNLVWGTNDS